MNDVSWRRILEQVDRRQQFGHDQDTAYALPTAHVQQQPLQQNVDLPDHKDELARVTERRAHAHANSKTLPVRKHQPSPGQHATQLKLRMERAAAHDAPPVFREETVSRKPSGVRNLIAVSLSIAITGFAAYQLHKNMQHNNTDGEITTAQHTSTTSPTSSNDIETAQPGIHDNGNRRDLLRPSLASQSNWLAKKLAAAEASETAPPINMANISAILPSTESDQPDIAVNDTLILERGRNVLEKGHVSGARLIFEYLADRGSALGAFALAQTYDPNYINKHQLPAHIANEKLANKWYQLAADLTDPVNP